MDGGRRRGRSKHSVAGSDFRAGDRPAPRPGTGTRKEAGCVPCDPETSTRLLGKAKDQGQEAQGRGRAGGEGSPVPCTGAKQQGREAAWEDAP